MTESSRPTLRIPAPLLESIKNGQVVLFLGAGASMEVAGPKREKAPSANQLAEELAQQFLGKALPGADLMTAAALAIRNKSPQVVYDYLRERLAPIPPSDAHKLLPRFRWHTIATTNYDTLIEKAYGSEPKRLQELIPFVKNSEPVEHRKSAAHNPLVLLKLHGCINHALDRDIPPILTPAHYERYAVNRDRLFNRLSDLAHELTFLFIGYSLDDPHVANMLYRLDRTGDRPTYYAVSPGVSEEMKQYWAANKVEVIDATFGTFMKTLNESLPIEWRDLPPSLLARDVPIRRHFRSNSDPSELLVETLQTDVVHIHPAMATSKQDPQAFYRGYDTGFGSIVLNLDVRRRAANDLLYAAIDSTNASDNIKFLILRGPAGSGKSIALKRIAWDLAADFDGLVLWLNDSGVLRTKALLELASLTGKRIFLVIDRVSKQIVELKEVLGAFFTSGRPITVIAAERDNAWNTYASEFEEKWRSNEFRLTDLLANEIVELVEKLQTHHALGLLERQPPEARIRAFELAQRQLLVALHEATLGKKFEEIILDEYNAISPPRAQRLYLDICTLNQLGAPVRAGLINRVLSIPFSLYQTEFFEPLENVVLTHRNKYSGDYEYRARHPHVASLVFQQVCPTDAERVEQLTRIVMALDVGFRTDKEALDQIVKGRSLSDLIADIQWGREFYRALLEQFESEAFIWQQRAIYEMHAEGGSLELAEQYATKGLSLDPKNVAIAHTLAEVSRRRSRDAPTTAQREFYRRQARERIGGLRDRTSFSEGTRCKLLLDEMEEARQLLQPDDDISSAGFVDAVRDAEIAIRRAIDAFPDDSEMHRLSARFWKILEEDKKVQKALERAWTLRTKGVGVALQLAKVYADLGDREKSLAMLQGIMGYSLRLHDSF